MSDRCSTQPSSTLYGTSLSTATVTRSVTATVTLAGGQTSETVSLDLDTIVQTQSSPTATLFATQCDSATSQQRQRMTATRTVEESSTQPGGNVVVHTVIRTLSWNGVVIETQTAPPAPPASPQVTDVTESQHHSNSGAIAGGIVGAVAFLALLAACLWFARKRRKNAQATRNLDEFFSDPTATAWEDKTVEAGAAGGTAGRKSTLRSFKHKSLAVLDLEKEKKTSSENDGSHWAALTRIDSAQADDDGAEPPTYGRTPSRQSLNAAGRPLSFHSMSLGHGVGAPHEGRPADGMMVDRSMPQGSLTAEAAILLRNDSDRSSKSDNSPNGMRALSTHSVDMLPSFMSNASPPISPTSPYSSPPLREMPLREGVPLDNVQTSPSSPSHHPGARPGMSRDARLSVSSGSLMQQMVDQDGNPVQTVPKARSWSTSTLSVPERPKSALGLSGPHPPLSGAFVPYAVHQSPPQSPSMGPVMATPSTLTGGPGLGGRASLNNGPPLHSNLAYRQSMQQQRSPPLSPRPYASGSISSGAYPPSQYTHLDVHKTDEERAEDHQHAIDTSSGATDVEARRLQQRRHRSLSGDLLLRVTNADTVSRAASTKHESRQMTPNSSGEKSVLSVRNVGAKEGEAGSAITKKSDQQDAAGTNGTTSWNPAAWLSRQS